MNIILLSIEHTIFQIACVCGGLVSIIIGVYILNNEKNRRVAETKKLILDYIQACNIYFDVVTQLKERKREIIVDGTPNSPVSIDILKGKEGMYICSGSYAKNFYVRIEMGCHCLLLCRTYRLKGEHVYWDRIISEETLFKTDFWRNTAKLI